MDSPPPECGGGKCVRYTQEQVDVLESLYLQCPKPTALKRHQLVNDSPILSNIHPKQIKVWFQNRRCREKQRKEATELQSQNWNLTAMNKLLMEENERLQKQLSGLVYENGSMKHKLLNRTRGGGSSSMDTSSPPHQQRAVSFYQHHIGTDANSPAGLITIAEKTLTEFLSKATGTAVNWVQLIGMKPGPDSIGTVAVSSNCHGIAARVCDLVSLPPLKVAEQLKDSLCWYRDCRRFEVLNVVPTPKGGTIELIHMEMYAPTTLTSPRDFWIMRFSTTLEDGSLAICERSLTSATGGPWRPCALAFVRGEIFASGYLIRSCEDGGSILHIVNHVDLDARCVPEVARPIYESSTLLAQRSTLRAMRHIRELADEAIGEVRVKGGRQPSVLRTFRQKMCRGFNDAVNGFSDDGWSMLDEDVVDDVTISVNTSSNCYPGSQFNATLFPAATGVLCAKATMLLQNVHPAMLVRFLREHRSEWADYGVDTYSAASSRNIPYANPSLSFSGRPSRHVIIPLAKAAEYDEFLELVRIEGQPLWQGDLASSHDMYLLQLCTGIDENGADACAELIFTSTDESFADNDAPLLPSGFRVIPLDPKPVEHHVGRGFHRTRDLTSFLEIGTSSKQNSSNGCNNRSILVIAFQFSFENPYLGNVASMARQFVHNVIASVQRVSMAIAQTKFSDKDLLAEVPEAHKLSSSIFQSYRCHAGVDLFRVEDNIAKQLWNLPDAVMCCSVETDNGSPVFTFANKAGLDLLETHFGALQNITLEKVLDEAGHANLFAAFSKIMQQGIANLPAGRCTSSMGRTVAYDSGVAWKVVNEDSSVNHCLAFKFVNWCFI